jgi:phospholipase A1/A2
MIKAMAIPPNSATGGFTMALRLIFLSVAIFFISCCHNIVLAQENASSEINSLEGKNAEYAALPVSAKKSETKDKLKDKTFFVTLHRPNYFLGATYNDNPNAKTYTQSGRDVPNKYEAKFQLSFKMLLKKNLFNSRGDLFAAYTQRSWWQLYSTSAPFRETNYEPELFLRFDTDIPVVAGLRNNQFLIGFAHQSNGQGMELSRSWNRIYIEFIAKKDDFMLGLKPWYRIPENNATDDNPDIDKYLGYGKLYGAYRFGDFVVSFTLHNNLRWDENKGGLELGLSYGLMSNLRLYFQYFNGYGDSLIDYDNFTNRIGIGLMINDWL